MTPRLAHLLVALILLAVSGLLTLAQHEPISPPLPPPVGPPTEEDLIEEREKEEKEEREREAQEPEDREPFLPSHDGEWGLPREFLDELAARAVEYRNYALSFTCSEDVRTADYDASGEASAGDGSPETPVRQLLDEARARQGPPQAPSDRGFDWSDHPETQMRSVRS